MKKVVPCYQFDALFSHKDGKSGVTVYSQDHYDQNMLDRPENSKKDVILKKEDECIIDVNLGKYNYKMVIRLNFLMIMELRHIRL